MEPTLIVIPDTPPNPLLKVRILRPAWSDLVRALARFERLFVILIQSSRDRGALYHAVIRYNERLERANNPDLGALKLNGLALIPSPQGRKSSTSGDNADSLNWLVTIVKRGLTERENIRTYEAMGALIGPLGEVSPRHSFLPHLLAALEGGFIPAPRHGLRWKGQRTQMRKFIKKRALAAGITLDRTVSTTSAWVSSTEDTENNVMLLSFSPYAREVWKTIRDRPALYDAFESDDDEEEASESEAD